ncbi:MAG TPA: spore coat U domain-containing protein [Thermoanaerobaculia bacterium]|nr:spore coat U domain-containing protein [Thermoanaerobaculia bacterium]
MREDWRGIRIGAALLMAALAARGLSAGDTTAIVEVSATVAQACRVSATNLQFGGYDPFGIHAGAPLDAECRLKVECTRPVSASLRLEPHNGTPDRALLLNGADELVYGLYHDATRLQTWADLPLDGGGSRSVEVPIFGRIFGGQDAISGDYHDTIMVRLDF